MSMFISDENIYKLLDCSENKSTGFKEVSVLNTTTQEGFTFEYNCSIRFFNDSNGVGHTWVDYEIEKLLISSDYKLDNEFIEEVIAEIEYSEKLKEYESYF